MKATIAIHPTYDICEDILTIGTHHIILKGEISITSVLSSSVEKDAITVYVNQKPYRIDQQGDYLFLIDQAYAENHPKPLVFCEPEETFGKPTTIYLKGGYDCSPEYYQKLYSKVCK